MTASHPVTFISAPSATLRTIKSGSKTSVHADACWQLQNEVTAA